MSHVQQSRATNLRRLIGCHDDMSLNVTATLQGNTDTLLFDTMALPLALQPKFSKARLDILRAVHDHPPIPNRPHTARAKIAGFTGVAGKSRAAVAAASTPSYVLKQVDIRVLQCVAVCCNVLQRAAVCCRVLQCVAMCCNVLQCVAECCNVSKQVDIRVL